VRSQEKQGKAGSYIVRFKKTLKSWLKFNDIDLKIDVKNQRRERKPKNCK